ncbi:unnamed protein product [Rotaria sp. Silwood1]|nr:unnamed protein product [Rotaria sp. Silwood1]
MLHCLILSILSTERLISNETNQNDVETTPNTIYEKSLLSCSNNQPYSITCIDSISMYFDKIQNYVELTCQFSTGDIHDLLRFIIFILEKIYINKFQKKTSFLSCEIDQIISCCTLSKTLLSIFKYLYQRHGILLEQRTKEYNELYLRLIERNYKLITKTHAYASCLFLLESHEVDLNSYDILLSLIKDDNLTQKIISISLEKLLIVGQYPKNDIWC